MALQNPLLPVPVDEPSPPSPATATGLTSADLAHLAEELRLPVATVRPYKAGLAAVHKAAGHADPTDNEPVRQIMKGIARAHRKVQKQARPLTAEVLATIKATAGIKRPFGGRGKGLESAQRSSWRARLDLALLNTLRDGLMRRSEAAALTWSDVQFRDDGVALITLRRSKTDQEAEGVLLYIGREAAQVLLSTRPAPELLDPGASVFGMTTRNIGKQVTAAAKAPSLGAGPIGHSGRAGIAQDLAKTAAELPALMTAGRQ